MKKDKTLIIFWFVFLLAVCFILKVSAAPNGMGNDQISDDESTLVDDNRADDAEPIIPIPAANTVVQVNQEPPVFDLADPSQPEQHAQIVEEEDEDDHDDYQPRHDTPESVCFQIIADERDRLSSNMLALMNAEQVGYLLNNPTGAKLVGLRYKKLLPEMIGLFEIDDFNPEFFEHLAVFSDNNFLNINSIPAAIIIRAVQLQSITNTLNLNGLIEKLENLDPDVSLTLDPVYILPHLFNFPCVNNPSVFMGRGLAFNPDGSASKKDLIIWNISLQLFIYNLIENVDYAESKNFAEVIDIIFSDLHCGHEHGDSEFKFNYFRIPETVVFTYEAVFNTASPFALADGSVTIDQISSLVGLPSDFNSIDYKELSCDLRILYRLLVYISIFNPSIHPNLIESIFTIFEASDSNDFTESEIKLLYKACLDQGRSDIIAKIYKSFSSSLFRKLTEPSLINDKNNYDYFIKSLSSPGDILAFIGLSYRVPFDIAIDVDDETYFRSIKLRRNIFSSTSTSDEAAIEVEYESDDFNEPFDHPIRCTKWLLNGNSMENNIFNSHFLSKILINSLGSINRDGNSHKKTFRVPHPDSNFFNERIDHLLQNLNENDFGEANWATRIVEMEDPVMRDAYVSNEQRMVDFVMKTFKAIHMKHRSPRSDIEILFDDSPGYGEGVYREALELFSRAILLPQFKVFYYNRAILGFIPYPLLHPDIMGVLGFISSYFIKTDTPVNWYLPQDYIKFLFYDEDTNAPMQDLIEKLYPEVFKIVDNLVNDFTNPLDYFPTFFRAHQPLPLTEIDASPFDIFNPQSSANSNLLSLSAFLDEESAEILDEYIDTKPKRRHIEEDGIETKDDIFDLIESKECDQSSICEFSRIERQRQMKQQIVEAMRQTLSSELIDHLLMGRFAFIRQFMNSFNEFSRSHVNSDFYLRVQAAQQKEFEASDIISGLIYNNAHSEIQIADDDGLILTPKMALERILQSYDPKMLRRFYWFCTGCFNLPLQGLCTNSIKVDIDVDTLLPTAATCFRLFRFHTRPTLAENIVNMYRALTETSGYQFIEGRVQSSTRRQIIVVQAAQILPDNNNEVESSESSESSDNASVVNDESDAMNND